MRILIVSHEAGRTGAPLSALQLAEAMKALGHDIRIVLRRGGPLAPRFAALAQTDIWRKDARPLSATDAIAMAARYDPIMALKCLRTPDRPYCLTEPERRESEGSVASLRAWSPDAVYANTTHCGDVIDALALAAPVFTHVREMAPTIAALDPRRRRSALERSRYFFCASQFVANDLMEKFAVPAYRLQVEPPAVSISDADIQAADENRGLVEDALGLGTDDRLVLGAGTLIARKGPDLFVEAADKALAAYAGPGRLVFAWLGEGDMAADLRARIAALGRSADVLLPGAVGAPLPYFRRAAAVLVSSTEDPYPRVAIEAAAMGAPVIAFDAGGGAADMIRAYAAGDLIAGFDAAAMGAAAAQRAAAWPGPDAALSARILAGHGALESARRIVATMQERLND